MKKLTVVLLLLTLSLLCSCAGAPRVSVTGGTAVTTPGESVADTEEEPATEQTDAAEEAVESVNLDAFAEMTVGDERIFEVSVCPQGADPGTLTWTAEDQRIASVDQEGRVTALRAGVTRIKLSAEKDGVTLTSVCALTVKEPVSASSSEKAPDASPAQSTQAPSTTAAATAAPSTAAPSTAPATTAPATTAPAASSVPAASVTESDGFFIDTSDGTWTRSGGVYTLSSGGTYVVKGELEGRIVVDAGDDEVTLELAGVTIESADNSPVLAVSADSLKIKAAAGTENTVTDLRSAKTVDSEDQGEGAISARCDLKLSGAGSLTVTGSYNNGIHTTKDLKIQELTLSVSAPNNALKGKDSVTLESGDITVISTAGDGIKTENTDVSSKGNQRGTVAVKGGEVKIFAAGDGIQAAYDFVMDGGDLAVYTASNSAYTSKTASVDSYKGIKAANTVTVNAGTLELNSYDDGLHADYGAALDNGSKGEGTVNINGGTVICRVNSSSGRYVSGADAIHADNTLNVTGGTVDITSAYEGLEANFVNISGGDIKIVASDDGINAAKKIGLTPAITVSGGRTDITMAGGDTDGIDSNGTFVMTDGVVIVRGAPNSNSSMATGLDCDGSARISGGTFIQLGARETVPSLSGGTLTLSFGASGGTGAMGGRGGRGGMGGMQGGATSSAYAFSSGTWTLSGLNISFEVASGCTYYGATVYSSALSSGTQYTLSGPQNSYTASAG